MNPIDVVLPVHNEAGSIEATLREFHRVATADQLRIRFVVCEDGSSDNTVEILRKLEGELPILLITGAERKGYSRAVIDGFKATTSDRVAFIDSDGQCDPSDLKVLVRTLDETPGRELVVGYRNPRSDHWIRLAMSGAFKHVYRMFFNVPVRDPSCPYLLIRRPALERILAGKVGILKQGFWWEFIARATAHRTRLVEVPVAHRPRSSGETQVYRPSKVPRIALEHLLGLRKLRMELSRVSTENSSRNEAA